ncbi:HsmA family protein [Microlunatus ginsengisoli]|uniref:HsmA family protein n=1 Tax=Microlunatus ginsengisoli TaxID=363863 RepID=A0ABP7A5M4_9ACTN
MLAPAIVVITLALVFYSVGVWGERIQGILKPWHAVFFGLGLAADATGTFLMTRIAAGRRADGIQASGLSAVMAVSGTIAIALMAIHLVWAVVVLIRNREHEKQTFHRFSLAVWVLWLIPYVIGAASAMS